MTAPKITLVRQRYTPFGGAERFLSRALEALRGQGVAVTMAARSWEGEGEGVTLNPFYIGRLWRDAGFARAVCRHVASADVGLVQSHERLSCCDIYRAGDGVHRTWLRERNRLLSEWGRVMTGLSPYHHYVMAAEKAMFTSSRLRAVICNSAMVRDEILAWFPSVSPDKLHVIYSGVDLDVFHPGLRAGHRDVVLGELGIPLDAVVFLFVGSGFERKGAERALEALPDGAYLIVVGKDKKEKALQARAEKLGLSERVRVLGGRRDVLRFYGAADAFVLPTLYDPFPNVALEAMACGLPMVTSTKCGAVDLIQDGVNGVVCDALDIPALNRGMAGLMDGDVRKRMGAEARKLVEPYSLEAMGEKLLTLYRSLLDSQ